MNNDHTFDRIQSLFDVSLFKDTKVLIAGCGSGGGAVALQLAMSGVQKFALIDADTLAVENVIRHVCGRRYVGQKKVAALADVLKDRNPQIEATCIDADFLQYPDLSREIANADVVVLATDNEPTRYLLNELCVKHTTPFVVGRVFTRGIGGEVFSYRPGMSGCLACLESFLQRTPFREGIREIDLVSEDERERMYGMEIPEIKDSPGLAVDISFITSFHTRYALDAIARTLDEPPRFLGLIDENYLVWGNRAVHPFNKNFQLQRIQLSPQTGCLVCGAGDIEDV